MFDATGRQCLAATVTGLAVLGLLPLTGCSSDDSSADAPSEFTEEANQICRDARARLDPLAGDVFSATPDDERLAAFHDVLVADLERQLREFSALDAPPAVADEFAAYLDAAGRAIGTVSSGGPEGLLGEVDPFDEANELARRLGFVTCVS